MGLPEFTAELALSKSTRVYRGKASYGHLAPGQSGIPANVMPNQFDGSEESGDADETGLAAEAGTEDADLEENGDAGLEDFENGEESDLAGDDEGLGEEDEG